MGSSKLLVSVGIILSILLAANLIVELRPVTGTSMMPIQDTAPSGARQEVSATSAAQPIAPAQGAVAQRGSLSSRINDLQQSVVKIEMPGSRGSGIVLRQEDGKTIILTNKHVIEPAKRTGDVSVTTADHTSVKPEAIYLAPKSMDLAIVVLDGKYGTPATMVGDEYYLGDDVLALGSPKGIQGSVSKGIISNFGDDKTSSGYKHKIIQTDTAINHGNSGGGLFLASTGELIGINTFQMTDTQGLNFAIDIHELQKLPDFKAWERFN